MCRFVPDPHCLYLIFEAPSFAAAKIQIIKVCVLKDLRYTLISCLSKNQNLNWKIISYILDFSNAL